MNLFSYILYHDHGIHIKENNIINFSKSFILLYFKEMEFLIYNFFKDTGIEYWESNNLIHLYDHDKKIINYLLWRILIENVLLNGGCIIFIKLFSFLCLEEKEGKKIVSSKIKKN